MTGASYFGNYGLVPPAMGSTRGIAMVNVAGPHGEDRNTGDQGAPKFAWIAAVVGAVGDSISTVTAANAADIAAADAEAQAVANARDAREANAARNKTIITLLTITAAVVAVAVGFYLYSRKR